MKKTLALVLSLLLVLAAIPALAEGYVLIKGQNPEGLFGNPNQDAQVSFVQAVDANTTDKSAGFPASAFEVYGVTNAEVRKFMRAQDGAVERIIPIVVITPNGPVIIGYLSIPDYYGSGTPLSDNPEALYPCDILYDVDNNTYYMSDHYGDATLSSVLANLSTWTSIIPSPNSSLPIYEYKDGQTHVPLSAYYNNKNQLIIVSSAGAEDHATYLMLYTFER